ncbi:MAG: Fe-S cluster assembly protein SufD [candidate division KSB1 bacterium]|nr:Fe-S cluster assembly protein SufD [candidate division KSB1 bacterium]MDZ7368603.1 Fe-S cluster assembly protein SufD [candidate division KSB1 bacterium]MDZ7406361.1 Fe-S cluster assembly protein SufD [candidate division KSB1 bacterium]
MEKTGNENFDIKNWYLSNFDFFESKLNGRGAIPFHETRRAAISRFAELGFPTPRHEEWKYTNVAPLLRHKFKLAQEPVHLTNAALAEFIFAGLPQNLLVLVNGRFAKELSHIESCVKGLVMGGLAQVLEHGDDLTGTYLGRYADYENETFIALNTAFADDGAFIRVPRNVVLDQPIHLLNISDAGKMSFVAHPRNLIIIGEGSQVQIIESYHALSNQAYFNNVVTEIVVEENALVDHVRIQNESRQAYHVAAREVHQAKGSVYSSISIDFGGALVRNNLNLRLKAENCEGNLFGFYMAAGQQLVDNHTLIDHAMPHCNSKEHYKGILDDKARGVFNGKVMVRPDAQKTNAYQSNQCLLLSNEAVINAKPQLEIFADDVKCSHGAAIGQLDEDAAFYLRSRGIGEKEANAMLQHAYASEVLDHIKIKPVREQLDKMVTAGFKEKQ